VNREDLVKVILDTDVDVNMTSKLKESALHLAARGGYFTIVDMILKKGANPNLATFGKDLGVFLEQACGIKKEKIE